MTTQLNTNNSKLEVNSFPDYLNFVKSLKKDPVKIRDEISAAKLDAVHMALGVAGESGELVDAIKKWAIYNRDLDITNVKEEIGDLLFYLTGLAELLGIQLTDVIDMNVEKLRKRYESLSYSDSQAIERKDKE
jgi:NTP pyrophosphatase (non-canonical NTP hydrolase)